MKQLGSGFSQLVTHLLAPLIFGEGEEILQCLYYMFVTNVYYFDFFVFLFFCFFFVCVCVEINTMGVDGVERAGMYSVSVSP